VSKEVKRTRITVPKTAAVKISIRPITREKNGSVWVTYLVQGWKEDGKWQRRQFKDEAKAQSFAALKHVETTNKGRAQRMILSPLTQTQHDKAVAAIDRLGDAYSIADAVEFFLKHHRPPDFTIRLKTALKLYLDEKERDGLRPRTHAAIKRSIERFIEATNDSWTHEVTRQDVEGYLRGVRSADGKKRATKKTWNNTLNELRGFFAWCAAADKVTNRPFTFENPAASLRAYDARQVREEQNARPITTNLKVVERIFSALYRWREGNLVRYFALAYFAGIRPAEIQRMTGREAELINLKTRTITIPANISKTRHERHITISDNLAAWLMAFPPPVTRANFGRMLTEVKKHFGLTHDEARHSFISYHVALHRSMGDAALQAGNSESIIRRHYLNLHPRDEGEKFFRIFPDAERRRAVVSPQPKSTRVTSAAELS
jgi:site-specific recombinase XerD